MATISDSVSFCSTPVKNSNVLEPVLKEKLIDNKINEVATKSCAGFIGCYLQKPLAWGIQGVATLFVMKSLIAKTSAVFMAIIIFPIIGTLAGIGTLIWIVFGRRRPPVTITNCIAPAQRMPSSPSLKNRNLKILTWNVALGPSYMATFNNITPPHERVKAIAKTILEKKADIVCLQEVFDEDSEKDLVEALNAQGYDCLHTVISSKVKLSSGLLMAVRRSPLLQLTKVGMWKFTNLASWDRASSKGVLGLQVKASVNGHEKNLCFFNVHQQADYPGTNFASKRVKQINSLKQRMKEFMTEDNSKAPLAVICGDLNFTRDNDRDEYNWQMKSLKSVVYDANPKSSLDYILFDKHCPRDAVEYETIGVTNQISDHDILMSTVDLTRV